jgi:tripartite-type tricarboxylate transporter receptor subunit TctC
MFAAAPIVLLVEPKVPARSVAELVALSHAKPGSLNYASGASLFNLTMELFKHATGADITYVPYRGSVQSLDALLAAEVQVVADIIQTPLPFIRDGRLRALAVTGTARAVAAPDIPTMAEAGVSGVETSGWTALYAPAGTPDTIVTQLDAAVRRVLDEPSVLERIHAVGYEKRALGPAELGALMRREIDEYRKIAEAAHVPMLD